MQTFRDCFLQYMEESFEASLTLSDLKLDNLESIEKFLKGKLEAEGLERFEDVFHISDFLDEGLLDNLSNYFKNHKNALLLAAALSILGWSMSDVVKNFIVMSFTNSISFVSIHAFSLFLSPILPNPSEMSLACISPTRAIYGEAQEIFATPEQLKGAYCSVGISSFACSKYAFMEVSRADFS